MKALSLIPKTIFVHSSSPLSPRISLLFLHSVAGDRRPETLTPPSSSPISTSSSSSLYLRRHHDEESKSVRVAVWWDFENCHIPGGVNVFRVANRITSALRSSGIKGPVAITAFGDVAQLSRSTQEALISTGISLTHVPHSGKNSSDRSFMADVVYWIAQNPPPAHFFLISGDKDFANILHRLRMSNYNVLLASPDSASGVLCSAATIMWPWAALAKGEDFSGKHFNHPPDGLYGSWYGHYKGVLDDPFADSEQVVNSQPEESMESISEAKPRAIPKAVVNGIRQVLYSYPEGVNLSDLRAELKRNNIVMDKDLFGYKKFSHLLASMPHILKFIRPPPGEGQPVVICTHKRATEPVEPRSGPARIVDSNDESKGNNKTQSEKTLQESTPTVVSESLPSHGEVHLEINPAASSSQVAQEAATNGGPFERIWRVLTDPQLSKSEPSKGANMRDTNDASDSSTLQQREDADVREGLVKWIWRTLNRPIGGNSSEKNDTTYEVSYTNASRIPSCKNSDKVKDEKTAARSKNDLSTLPISDSRPDKDTSVPNDGTKKRDGAPGLNTGLFSRIRRKLKWWRYDEDQEKGTSTNVIDNKKTGRNGEPVKSSTCATSQAEGHDLFSKSYFWGILEPFLLTSKGSDLISKSRTREELVQGLRKDGPWLLKDMKESHLLYLINLLILDKKWVEESASQYYPFRLTFPPKRKCVPSHGSNGLSSLFAARTSASGLQNILDQEKHDQEFGHPETSYGASLDTNVPQNVADLRAWLQKTYNGIQDIEPEEFQKLFERSFGRKLLFSSYGYLNIHSLLAACLADSGYNKVKRRSPPNREEILSDCHKLLKELLEQYPDGFNMSIFRPIFIQKYGYVLDYQMLGYPKLQSMLQIMPGARIESSFVLPTEKFQSEDEKRKVVSRENEGKNNGEDYVWEELGPVSDAATNENNNTQEASKELSFDEASLADEEFSDSEDESASQYDGSDQHLRRGEEDSSLLQILDSWYSSKEGGGSERSQGVDGLVDCSRSNHENPVDVKSTDSEKLKVRPHKRYSFVSESRDDEKEKLVESILGSLKKAGESRLHN
ncbi:uncharacterized protein [Typha angustifolia]|uniref:uncharacterized protein n=1 Tax=Typha angustifolia TaxID=59011 RepID=UPI003C2ABD9A